ncbi:hypothetical protein EDD85DRAFT_797627 [Armillaria nabsnona]|nr:hypothetical protein EDD85DRAFT_797627 [Armillaria nabsnona]
MLMGTHRQGHDAFALMRVRKCVDAFDASRSPDGMGTEAELEPGPDFDEDERQEWFRAREEQENAKKKACGPVPKPRMISRKRKAISEPETAETLVRGDTAKPSERPAKRF